MRRIAVLTSGGDAPGMNTAIRAVVRTGIDKGWDVLGIRSGYAGLMAGNFVPMGAREVGGIIQRGGAVLGSARALAFKMEDGRTRDYYVVSIPAAGQSDIGFRCRNRC